MNWADRNTNAISLLNCYRPTDREKVQGSNRVESSFCYPVDGLRGKPVFYFGGKGSGECLVVMLLYECICLCSLFSDLSESTPFFVI